MTFVCLKRASGFKVQKVINTKSNEERNALAVCIWSHKIINFDRTLILQAHRYRQAPKHTKLQYSMNNIGCSYNCASTNNDNDQVGSIRKTRIVKLRSQISQESAEITTMSPLQLERQGGIQGTNPFIRRRRLVHLLGDALVITTPICANCIHVENMRSGAGATD